MTTATTASSTPAATLVLFGARGDLVRRLLVPALYDLRRSGLLPEAFLIVGVDRVEGDTGNWRDSLRDFLAETTRDPLAEFQATGIDAEIWNWLAGRLEYVRLDFAESDGLAGLRPHVSGNAIFYLAVPSRLFGPVIGELAKAGLLDETPASFRRVVVEKPFGLDLASAQALNRQCAAVMKSEQIFRIDHFLGKEEVRNILITRFANMLFEPVWNSRFIDNVQISATETITVGTRGAFYESTGALRDMVPNHLFQLLSLVAMEPPTSLAGAGLSEARQALFEAIEPVQPGDVVRGQYEAGVVAGEAVPAYRATPGVDPHSRVETFVALKLHVDTPRWEGVPFYLRTGKAMGSRVTEVVVTFRAAEALAEVKGADRPNRIIFRIQPDGGVRIGFEGLAQGPGLSKTAMVARMFEREFSPVHPDVGYEALLYGCLHGDHTLFQRADNVERAWAVLEPVLQAWKDGGAPESYSAGSDGPAGARELLARDGRAWEKATETDGQVGS
ncbi:glucose-6-phosphate dehydrogenase [Acetobacter estunensis]|uniref:Glucose-6-phosphate 1-dehydrogenase n=1 Tax=Acetobacter estunensis TaxID=104097 RepID=A0A967B5V7_9PROT|nr:glucose-6-phosphate dehydrogenase [Acetobacter estunensis]NHO54380.1 glucose-6-phosphate dehydrogenase [Acetobacter estunensis]